MTGVANDTAMTPSSGAGSASTPDPRLMHRFRLAAICTVLVALTFMQDPGRIAADTKLDLAVDPGGFLTRALTLWEPLGFFGQLQNQAYGYLFPVGPAFLLGDLVGLPAWVVQRLWWSTVLILAFLGVVRLARQLGVANEPARIVAGLAYVFAPRMVTEIGVLTTEVLPFALAPWVLIPLVSVAQGRVTRRRGAALSGVAILLAGGVNAVATVALLPLGAWWILTRFRGRALMALGGWWLLAIALATLWWAVPLLLLGNYSPPFLDWIESSAVTTLFTTPDTVVRGTSQWVAYVVEPGGPVWPGGWQLVSEWGLILAAGGLAALGLVGLAARSTPYRVFLVGGLLMGTVLVSLGHTGAVQGLGAPAIQEAMDGVLAPLRNTHKFDLVLRLPISLGVGFAVQIVLQRIVGGRHGTRIVVIAGATMLIAVGAWPMMTGTLVRDRSFVAIPNYWGEAASWLESESPDGRALLVPGASFGIYGWGRTQDEPLQPLARTAWAVRDAVPLSSAGNIRWLDAVQERVDSGRGSPGLADALARAGVEYVVVRNDIDQRRSGTPRTVLLRQALVRSGGFTPVAGFGPALPPFRTPTSVVDDGLQDTVAAVEIWRVDSPFSPGDPRVALRDASQTLVVSGSAEAVPDLADAGLLYRSAIVTQGDEGPLVNEPGVTIVRAVTDGFRRTEVTVGASRDNRSQTLGLDDPFLQDRRVHDYLPLDPQGLQAVAVFEGGTVTASSSGSDVTSLRGRSAAAQPWAALDGDPATAWVSGDLDRGVGQWWEVSADRAFSTSFIVVRLVVGELAGTEPTSITVSTDTGALTVPVELTDQPQRLAVPPGPTYSLRLTLDAVLDGSPGEAFGLREVQIPGVDIVRSVVAPGTADGGPIVLTARRGEQSGCAGVAGQLVCTPALGRSGEERAGLRRVVEVKRTGDYRVRITVRPRVGASLDQLLTPALSGSPLATASSVFTSDPANRPQAAMDGVLSTSWIASPLDTRPELTASWEEPRRIRGVRIELSPDLVASRPLRVTTTVNGRESTDIVSARGTVRVPAQEARSLTLRFDNAEVVRSIDPATGAYVALPIGINEVRILGAEDIVKGPRLIDDVAVPCGFGPEVRIDGVVQAETSVTASVIDVLTDSLIPAVPCSGRVVSLPAGTHVIAVASTAQYVVESMSLEPIDSLRSTNPRPDVIVEEWGVTQRQVVVDAGVGPRILETTENANEGWTATLDGQQLTPIRVDGWRQGWLVPAGPGGTVAMTFAPQRLYAAGLGIGLLAAMALIALAAVAPGQPQAAPGPPRVGRRAEWLLAAGGVVTGLLIAGLPGVAVAVGAATLVWFTSRPLLVAVLGGAAAVGAATAPWPESLQSPDGLRITTALLTVAALAAVAAVARTRNVTSAAGDARP